MTSSTPEISIIVPAYNNAGELERCLQSLRKNGEGSEAEIIVIDDCSPGPEGAMEEAAMKHGAVYYRQAENAGPGVARNRGAEIAQGNILVFIDSDCVAPPGWPDGLVRPIREGRSCATMSCYCGPVTPDWISTFQDEDYRYRMPSSECDTSFVNSCNFAIQRSVFYDCGKFPEQRISEDFVLGLILSERGTPTRYMPEEGVLHGYYGDLRSYLKQRFSFAFNTVRSYLDRDRIRSKKANSNARSFNPFRTALGMLFVSMVLLCFVAAVAAALSGHAYASAFMTAGLTCLGLEISVHGRFLYYLGRRLGVMRALSYIFLLITIDMVYVYGVLRAIAYSK